jgi:hypothetical protein
MGGSISSGAAKAISLSGRSCLNCRHKASAKVCGGCAEFFSPWGVPSYSKWEPELPSLESRDEGTPRPKTEVPTRGLRYNKGKRRFDLIPPDSLAVLADVLTVGSEKYAERNWEAGMPYKDALGSLERHLQAWKAGEDNDPESGLPHLAHVMCNAMFILTWQLRNIGEDDRVKVRMPDAPSRSS